MDIKGITLIKNKHDYLFYLNSDKFALGINDKFILKIKRFFYPNYIYNFQKLMRKAEYYKNCKKGLFNKLIYAIIYKRYMNLSVKLGFSIPLNVFGPGLAIAHYGTIIVNHAAKIGVNCRLHADVNIGASNGSKIAPIIIAKNTAISANSVVNKSIEESGFMVAGIPAKKIKEYDIENVILFSKQAVEEGLERDYSCSKKEQNTIILNKINKKVNK
jgi:serine O-acetyltransferase